MTAPAKGAAWYTYQKALNEEVEAGRDGESSLLVKMNAIDAAVAAIIAGGVAFTKMAKTQAVSPYTVTSGDLVGTFCITNTGATGECVCNLPAGSAGNRIAFYVAAAQNLKAVADGSETFRFTDDQTAGGGYLETSTVGTFWTIEWDGSEWIVSNLQGQVDHAAGDFRSGGNTSPIKMQVFS